MWSMDARGKSVCERCLVSDVKVLAGFALVKCFGVLSVQEAVRPLSLSRTHPSNPVLQSVLINKSSQIETSLTCCNFFFCFYHPHFLLSSSVSLYIFFIYISPNFALLTHSTACDVPSLLFLGYAPLTVSFTRVSPVSSFSVCQPAASPGPRTPAQSQQWPEERPAHVGVCGCYLQHDGGEKICAQLNFCDL